MAYDREKCKDLIHYIVNKCSDDPSRLGAVKLNKVMYFCDFGKFYDQGEPMTGAEYVRQRQGPVLHQMLPLLDELRNEGRVSQIRKVQYGFPKVDYSSDAPVSLVRFSADEISMIDRTIDIICDGHTARSISDATHDEVWNLAENGEQLPYELAFSIHFGEVSDEAVSRAQAILAEELHT